MKTTATLVTLFTLFSFSTSAADYTRWELPEGAKARLGKGNLSGGIAYSPDGTRLAVGGSIGVWLYDTATFQVKNSSDKIGVLENRDRNGAVALLTRHTEWVTSIAFSPDGNTVAAGSQDGKILLWDTHTRTLIHSLTGHAGYVNSVAFSPDGNTVAAGKSRR